MDGMPNTDILGVPRHLGGLALENSLQRLHYISKADAGSLSTALPRFAPRPGLFRKQKRRIHAPFLSGPR
jgi:hypothetical protein